MSVPPDVAGLRVVVASGQRVDVTWTVPADAAAVRRHGALLIGCHIPGHWAKGMVVADPDRAAVTGPRERAGGTLRVRAGVGSGWVEEKSRMTYVIAEPCIDVLDISCVSVCPVDCIHYEEGVDRKLFIDPNECIDCGACEPECPVNAIFPEESLPTEWAQYTAIDATWYTDKAAARAAVDARETLGLMASRSSPQPRERRRLH